MTHSEKLKFLEQVYFEQVPNMLKYAEIALNNLPLAEDAVQTSFKIALEKIDDFINSPKPVGWIKNVLKNEIMHKRREQQKWQQNLLETELNQIPIYDEISISLILPLHFHLLQDKHNSLILLQPDHMEPSMMLVL